MSRLIRGLTVSLFKNKLFYIGLACAVIYNVFSELLRYYFDEEVIYWVTLNDAIKGQAAAIVIIWGAICPFIVGEDFNGGMIRNKIVAGFSKRKIFLSSLIVSFIGVLIFCAIDILSITGAFFARKSNEFVYSSLDAQAWKGLLITVWYMLAVCFAVTCISCTITMLTGNRAISLVAFFILSFAVISACTMARFRLAEPKNIPKTTNGEIVEFEPNELFLEEGSFKRKAFKAVDYIGYFSEPITATSYINAELSVVHGSFDLTDQEMDAYNNDPLETAAFDTNYCIGYMAFGAVIALYGVYRFKYCNLK